MGVLGSKSRHELLHEFGIKSANALPFRLKSLQMLEYFATWDAWRSLRTAPAMIRQCPRVKWVYFDQYRAGGISNLHGFFGFGDYPRLFLVENYLRHGCLLGDY
jgi:hypothetical protein